MTRVLLSGASGFVGGPALRALLEAGYEVHAISSRPRPVDGRDTVGRPEDDVRWHSADLLAGEGDEALLAAVRPELLLHLAWYAEHGRFWSSTENVRWVEATLRLLRAFVAHGGRRAVLAGTCAEYEWSEAGGRLSERDTPLRPATLYGASKDATREVAEAFAREAGIELCWGRVFFPYGPGEPAGRLVPSIARSLLAGQPAELTEGSQIRDFIHVEDVAGAFAALLASAAQGAVNVGTGEGISVREVAELLGETTGRGELLRIGALERRPGEPRELVADAGRLRGEVGFQPRVSIGRGLEATVAWWRERVPGGR